MRVDDLVLVIEHTLPRNEWLLGRVVAMSFIIAFCIVLTSMYKQVLVRLSPCRVVGSPGFAA